MLASNTTPKYLQANRSFIDRKNSYDPNKWDGIVPDDWKYSIPVRYSTLGAELPKSHKKSNKENDKEKEKNDDKNNLNKTGENTNNNQNPNQNKQPGQ